MRLIVDKKKFTARTKRFIDKEVPSKVVRAINAIAVELQKELVSISPVDTGFFKSQWQVQFSTHISQPAQVVNFTTYGPYINYGTIWIRGRFFLENVHSRSPEIADRVVRRFKDD